jgi:hypothetical protein
MYRRRRRRRRRSYRHLHLHHHLHHHHHLISKRLSYFMLSSSLNINIINYFTGV